MQEDFMVEQANTDTSVERVSGMVSESVNSLMSLSDKERKILEKGIVPESVSQLFVTKPEDIAGIIFETVRKKQIPVVCTENVYLLLLWNASILGKFRYDEFRSVTETNRMDSPKSAWQQIEDVDEVLVQTKLSRHFPDFARVTRAMVRDAIGKMSHFNRYDSARDWLKSLTWDGVDRLESWLLMTYGVRDTKYHRAVGSNWLKGLVKRIVNPGCKFDFVLVLEGPQGSRKSMSLGILGSDWHVETTMSTDNKDFFMQMKGKAIIEFAEGETLSRTETKRMKAIITTQVDTYRPAYGRNIQDFPRRCVFAMTTNQDRYFKDETGNRRFFPVAVAFPKADIEWLADNRDQVFAEAYHRVIVFRESVWEDMPDIEVIEEQAKRMLEDPNQELIEDWYWNVLSDSERSDGITVLQAYNGVFNQWSTSMRPMTRIEEMQVANVIKNVLGLVKRQTIVNRVRKSRWYDPKTEALEQAVEASLSRSVSREHESSEETPREAVFADSDF